MELKVTRPLSVRLLFPSLRRLLAAATALACAAGIGAAQVQDYPARPLRIITSTAPGGVTDLLARTVGQQVSESTGQSVVVEDRPGAATLMVKIHSSIYKARPDAIEGAVVAMLRLEHQARVNFEVLSLPGDCGSPGA